MFCLVFGGCGKPESRQPSLPTNPAVGVSDDSGNSNSPQTPATIGDAVQLFERGDLANAEKIARSLVLASPNDIPATTILVSILAERGEFRPGIALLDELAIANLPERDQIEAQAADLAFQSGDAEKAIDRFERLVARSPGFHIARRRLARLLNDRGYRFDANEHLRVLARDVPLEADELRGIIYPMLPFVNVSAKPNIHDAKEIQKLGLLTAARALQSQGDVIECLELLSVSTQSSASEKPAPRSENRGPAIEAFRLWVLALAQQYDALRVAVASAPLACQRYPEFWLAAGTLALQQQDESAIDCFAQAILREPNWLTANESLVLAAEQMGRDPWASEFRNRVRQVQRVQTLTRQIVTSQRIEQADFVELAELSSDIGHLMESLLWQQLMIASLSPMAPQLQTLSTYKTKTVAVYPRGFDDKRLLCNVDYREIKPAEKWLAEVRSVAGDLDSSSQSASSHSRSLEAIKDVVEPVFQNVAEQMGVSFQYRNASTPVDREFQIFQAYGSGVACFDFDLDGNVDLYFGQAGSDPPHTISRDSNALYRNRGRQFTNVTMQADADDRRYTTGVTAGDWNQDGFADLAIGNLGGNRLLVNQGDGSFREQFVHSDWDLSEYTTSLAIADVTGDSLPDLVVVNYLDDPAIFEAIQYDEFGKPVSLPGPLHFRPGRDRVFASLGDESFESQQFSTQPNDAGSTPTASTGLGLLVSDIDANGSNDVLIANDLRANQYWVRDESTSETKWNDVAVTRGVAYGNGGQPMACMGIAAADIDRNGRMDLHITNFDDQWSNQYMQNESGVFVDQVVPLGVAAASHDVVGFGTQAIDYDNNSTWDLVVGNGHVEDFANKGKQFAMPTQLFAFDGRRFLQQQVGGDDQYWRANHWSRGLAKCDWNRDGKTDFVVTDLKQDVAILENQTTTDGDWLQIELVATHSERDAIGAIVTIQIGDEEWTQVVQTGDGYLSKNESLLHFGLSDMARNTTSKVAVVDHVTISWPVTSSSPEATRSPGSTISPASTMPSTLESQDEENTPEEHPEQRLTLQVFERVQVNSRVLLIQNEQDAWYR